MLAETAVKRQHYVPQFYMRPFTLDGNQIDVLDLTSNRPFPTSVENIAVESGLYDIDLGGVKLSTESWLAELETDAAALVAQLIEDPRALLGFSLEEDVRLARFVAALMFRGPGFKAMNQRIEDQIVSFGREMAHGMLMGGRLFEGLSMEERTDLWETWDANPNEWWMGMDAPVPHAAHVADMLAETQGWANLLVAKSWRIGLVPEELQLYTSDNPVSAHLTAVRPWWDHGGIMSLDYWLPLSPRVLLLLERDVSPSTEGEPLRYRGERRRADFTVWETSVARHITTAEASRFLLGSGPHVTRDCAISCLRSLESAKLRAAVQFTAFDPNPPQIDLAG